MEPIVLDKFGTKLFVNDDSGIADNSLLHFYQISGEAIGFHTCGADFLMYAHSETHNVMVCENCHFGMIIPNSIDTYGQLRQWCLEEIERQKKIEVAISALCFRLDEEKRKKF